jgi:hypothetical protein
MVKECAEEASIPDQLARQCKPAGRLVTHNLHERRDGQDYKVIALE